MQRTTIRRLASPAIVAASLAAAAAIAGCGSPAPAGAGSSPAASGQTRAPSSAQYGYYRSMMSNYRGGSMMGGGPGGWMMGIGGYRWMTGAGGIPGWMRGGRLPGYMMGAGADPGKIMGRFWANAPGPRVSASEAAALASQVPAGAHVDHAADSIAFTTSDVRLVAVASPPGGPDETFRIAGLVNPRIIVPAGARVSIQVINADPGTAHGLVVTASQATRTWMPMMTSRPAFAGSALWFLGNSTAAGLHTGAITFTAGTPGTYRYLCPVPGHAQKGMIGTLTVQAAK